MNRNDTGVVFFDDKGEIFFQFYQAKYTKFIPLTQIPEQLKQAVIVAEDKDFYTHPGFSIKAIIGALIANIRKKELSYGGSTITQQLIKINLLNSEKSFLRKYQELILAQEIERRFTKNEILEMYLNSVYFGEGAFGIEQAAKTYFGTSAANLTLSQSALLAGLLTAPSRLSPLSGNKTESIQRQKSVLSQMVEEGYISRNQRKQAEENPLLITEDNRIQYKAPHFALMVKDQLIKTYGEERIARSGFRIHTTLNLSWQKYAEETVEDQIEKLSPNQVSNGSAVVIDANTSEVKALVGSYDWYNNQFGKVNIATTPRQVGSSFKPIVYASGFEKHLITPATVLIDQPITYQTTVGPYTPQNFDRTFRGKVLVRRALANSLNVPSVEVMAKVGIEDALSMAQRLGISTLKDSSHYGFSLVLGSGEITLLELTNAYATFANTGKKNEPTLITKIIDKTGKTIYAHTPNPKQVLKSEYAFLITSILSDINARKEVFGTVLNTSIKTAVKTGTTEDFKDSLTIGYTPHLAIGVWVGNNDNTPMDHVAGSLGAAPIWKKLIEKFSKEAVSRDFQVPDSIVKRTICRHNGLLLNENASSYGMVEFFSKGTEPTRVCFLPKPTLIPNRDVPKLFQQPQQREEEKEKRRGRNDSGRH